MCMHSLYRTRRLKRNAGAMPKTMHAATATTAKDNA